MSLPVTTRRRLGDAVARIARTAEAALFVALCAAAAYAAGERLTVGPARPEPACGTQAPLGRPASPQVRAGRDGNPPAARS